MPGGKMPSMVLAYHLGLHEAIALAKSKQPFPSPSLTFLRKVTTNYKNWQLLIHPEQAALLAAESAPASTAIPAVQAEQFVPAAAKSIPAAVPAVPTPIPAGTVFPDDYARLEYLMTASGLPKEGAQKLAQLVVLAAERVDLDPLFVAAIIKVQSNFRWFERAANPVRLGLFMMNPQEGETIAARSRVAWGGAGELRNPKYAVHLGATYLRALHNAFHNDRNAALAAYLWGPDVYAGALKAGRPVPAEISKAAAEILTTYQGWKKQYPLR